MLENTMMNNWIFDEELLAKDVYVYANYEELQKKAAKEGAVMKESKEFYGDRILSSLERNFQGKCEEDIRISLSDCLALGKKAE